MTSVSNQHEESLDPDKARIERELSCLDLADPTIFFAHVSKLRSWISQRPDLTFSDEQHLSTQLHLFLDQLIATRVSTELSRISAEARVDHLTSIGNQRAFQEFLGGEIERSSRYQRCFTLVLFDLDRFKLVNDRYGHPAGNLLLIDFAKALTESLRQSDQAFRIGGDEFAAVLPETQLVTGETIIRRILHCPVLARWNGTSGVSWGIANWPSDLPPTLADAATDLPLESIKALTSLADQRLYNCKKLNESSRLNQT